MKSSRVTQKDVATLAGVHRSTVSLVLKNHPGIPAKTRQRVLRAAEKLGYEPDPMLMALAIYRSRSRPVTFHGTLAWLVNHVGGENRWKDIPIYREYLDGAKQRAKKHGYVLEIFDMNERGIHAQRLASMLRTRNVHGIILCPQPAAQMEVEFPWEDFSVVTLGHTLINPRLHMATATQYRNAVEAVRRLRAYGYCRIGYVVWADFNQRSDNNYWAGYQVETFSADIGLPIPPLTADFYHPKIFRSWYDRYRPDAILTADPNILDYVQKSGIEIPAELGVACFALPNVEGALAGMHENSPEVGAVAVDFLIGMIHRGERGIPEIRQRILVEGTWVEGNSLKKKLPE